MSKIAIINVNAGNVYSIVKDCIYSCTTEPIKLDDIKFHHNTFIGSIPNALKYGLLSKEMKARIIENRELTKEERFRYSDECYVNGAENISLSSTIEDLSLMYRDEMLYNTYSTTLSGIIISKNVKAMKRTTNYYNEYLVQDIIPVELFNSVEIRLLKSIEKDYLKETNEEKIKKIIEAYEILRTIALTLKENNLDIPLRESSNVMCNEESHNALTLDPKKVIEMPKLILK